MLRWLKKIIVMVCVLSLLVSLLGCAKEEKTGTTETTEGKSTSSSSEEEVILTVWLPSNNESENKVMSEIMDAYNELNVGKVVVEYQFVPRANAFAYEDKISAAVTINQLPDVLMMDGPNVSNYAYSEIIKPITEFFTEDELDDFVASMLSQGTYNGELYALSPSESSVVIYYNKDIIDAAGIEVPMKLEDAWTFDEFMEIVKTVHKDGEVYGVNIAPDYGTGEWMTYMPTLFLWSFGGNIISEDGMTAEGYINSSASVEAMEYFQSLSNYSNWQATPTEFEEGRAAFKICGSWLVPGFEANPDLNWGITYLPYEKTHVAPSGDWAWGVSSTKHAKESADFLKYMLNAENIENFTTIAAKPPTRKSLLNASELWASYPRSIIKDQVINSGHPRPKTPAYPVVTQEFASAAVDLFLGADVKERLDLAASNIDENLQRYFK
ncbi:MAG: ABC transporter substrate-binding protein [Firmicutes bacterium HGW-Firmicutes-3]|jgi:fructooligosaccharide transport system substrate-binding protein|nr:MAG: ABC transporter substrate-binding protein [Firmicutes bacterium HGW-Firmicutes-3]